MICGVLARKWRIADQAARSAGRRVLRARGFASLIEVRESTAIVTMGGGCQGCAVSAVTLREGIQKAILEHVPEITEVVDSTDHDAGENPFYTD